MNNPTDETLRISCCECPESVDGYSEMVDHIKTFHPFYTKDEITIYAKLWMEAAYVANEQAEKNYWESKKGEPCEK